MMRILSIGMRIVVGLVCLVLMVAGAEAKDEPLPEVTRSIRKAVVVNASLDQVWDAWTTNEGAQSFFAPKTNIDPSLGGHYEIYFAPDQPYGKRGAERCRVHSIIPKRSLAFTWNAPPSVPEIRDADVHTIVFLRFEPVVPQQTRVELTHLGWGDSPGWTTAYEYFIAAWDVVLGRLKIRFAKGPIDWSQAPRPTESLNIN